MTIDHKLLIDNYSATVVNVLIIKIIIDLKIEGVVTSL